MTYGNTPTSAALQGGINQAKTFAGANPGHTVVLLLATDGLPTACTPQDIAGISAIAAAGKTGTPSVKTFVIGVFTTAEKATAQTNLDAIANAGGTNKAIVIDTATNVTTAFQAALDAIRGQALPCDYNVPTPEAGTPDYDKVNVQLTDAGGKSVVANKANAGACDPATGGWYYDKDPAQGQVPTKIEMCPATCDDLKTNGGQIDIKIGCQTIVPEAK